MTRDLGQGSREQSAGSEQAPDPSEARAREEAAGAQPVSSFHGVLAGPGRVPGHRVAGAGAATSPRMLAVKGPAAIGGCFLGRLWTGRTGLSSELLPPWPRQVT